MINTMSLPLRPSPPSPTSGRGEILRALNNLSLSPRGRVRERGLPDEITRTTPSRRNPRKNGTPSPWRRRGLCRAARYSLRARNNEFQLEELGIGINEAHQLGKKFFVARI